MAITDSILRLGASLIESLHTRLELASVEIEEEVGRYASYLLLSLLGLFFGIVTVLLLILLVLIVFWDAHREFALISLIIIFAVASVGIFAYLKTALKNKPRLLAASLNELQNDSEALRQTSAASNPAHQPANKAESDNEGF
ncbi:phage holin family protein [Undibacterium flavidum]|uniref:Phage holin family protein n=1 Tax=Undibacterium flavidum TaxID=2762297 RepID=A0ABR6YBJ8_9BURK|nr:phage holin family protein [Undibacterium flavidum]MBC3873938.1 phage holin family protein [Undibacterium flavidum]